MASSAGQLAGRVGDAHPHVAGVGQVCASGGIFGSRDCLALSSYLQISNTID
jgi:hypothetical protein